MNAIRVILVEDHAVLRDGLRVLFDHATAVELVAEASSANAFRPALARHSPDVVVLDLALPDVSGTELIDEVVSTDTACVVLTSSLDPMLMEQSLDAGAVGYVVKDDAFDELLEAVRAAADGTTFFSRSAASLIIRHKRSASSSREQLTPQEQSVLSLLAQGMSNKEMAHQLGVAYSTVKSHRLHLRQKLGLSSAAELTRYALKNGFSSLD